jgi:ubiquinone biosynthesis protein UbiJ
MGMYDSAESAQYAATHRFCEAEIDRLRKQVERLRAQVKRLKAKSRPSPSGPQEGGE